MKATFSRECLAQARVKKTPLIGVVHRKMGKSDRFDEQITVAGQTEPEVAEVVQALLLWIVDGDSKPERLEKLKALVAAL